MYEDSVKRLEQANAQKLRHILKFLWGNLQTGEKTFEGNPKLVAVAKTRAQIVIATAMQLLGEGPVGLDPAIASLVKDEVARVEVARGQHKPSWLGPPDPGFVALDYARYKPCGFYTKTAGLQRYFRAVRWLQSIPFRVSKDEELTTILMLGGCVTYDRLRDNSKGREELYDFFEAFAVFLGTRDDLSLMTATKQAQNKIDLDEKKHGVGSLAWISEYLQEMAKRKGDDAKINDQLAVAPDDPSQAAELSFRVIPAYRLPDGVLFQRTTGLKRPFPNGLEVCVLLGSPFARSRLAGEDAGKVVAEIDRCKPFLSGAKLYGEYLWCLEALLAASEPDAPPFMSSEVWQIKSCQTALAGWAQLRHTWVLQAKENVLTLGAHASPIGLVEPVPEFYARMARLVENTETALAKTGAFTAGDDPLELAADIKVALSLFEAAEKVEAEKDEAKRNKLREELQESITPEMIGQLETVDRLVRNLDGSTGDENTDATVEARIAKRLRQWAEQLGRGTIPDDPILNEALSGNNTERAERWRTLGIICRRLESLSHKQLRGVDFSTEERGFLASYGEKLANVMLYSGNTFSQPIDDAPRITNVFTNPNAGKHLTVGIDRPRAVYVLYPVKDGEILCQGAVMPYYEFIHDTTLTDAEWKSLLDSDNRPKSPDWLSPLIAPGGLSAPEEMGDD